MKQHSRLVESAIVAALAAALTITASFTGDVATKNTEDANTLEDVVLGNNVTAGVAGVLRNYEMETTEAIEQLSLSVEDNGAATVAATAEDEELTVEENTAAAYDAEAAKWQNCLMADVEESLNVRTEGNALAAVAGKLYKGDVATILEEGAEWTKISSGNLIGYVNNAYCVFGSNAYAYAKENCETVAKATTNGLRVRKMMDTESGIITSLYEGETITVDTTAETEDGWVAVTYKGGTYYVSADYVEVSLKTGVGVTVEEEAAAIEAAKKAAEEEAKKYTSSNGVEQKDAVEAEVDDVTLLAALIDCEAGGDIYEAQLAVGAVVCNRIKSKHYPNSLSEVIYQKGQFGPASSGKLARALKNGASKSARKAAKAALNGSDNTDGAKSFRDQSSKYSGMLIGSMVFF